MAEKVTIIEMSNQLNNPMAGRCLHHVKMSLLSLKAFFTNRYNTFPFRDNYGNGLLRPGDFLITSQHERYMSTDPRGIITYVYIPLVLINPNLLMHKREANFICFFLTNASLGKYLKEN